MTRRRLETRSQTGDASHDFAPNCWLTPEYDALKLHNDMTMLLNGRGGHIEQTYLYLDPSSAAIWCSIAEQEDYHRLADVDATDAVAERIADGLDLRAWMSSGWVVGMERTRSG